MEKENQIDLFDNLIAQKPRCNVDQHILQKVFNHYIENGFPYLVISDDQKLEEYFSLTEYKAEVFEKTFYSNSTGVALANSYHPHRYGISCGSNKTALSVFQNHDKLKRCIKKCIALSGSVDDSKLRSMLSIFEGTQVASNFPPGTAKSIYTHFLPSGGVVWDMSCGFGGRLLAAICCRNIKYYGTDPSTQTFVGLNFMISDLKRLGAEFIQPILFNHGSEVPLEIESNSVDFCFTSPPYFNTERYAEESTQSFKAYPYRDVWIKKFIGGTAENCKRILKPYGLVAFNIANVKSFKFLEECTVKEFLSHGFLLKDTFHLGYSMMPGKGSKNKQFESGKKYRLEPIFIFEKL
jgi:hypothetical protein